MRNLKRIISISAMLLMIVGVMVFFVSCGSRPRYDIYSIKYDPEAKLLTWYDDSSADKWIVSINGKTKRTSTESFSYDAQDKSFSFSIEGLFKRKGHKRNPERSGQMVYLDTVTGLEIKDGYLTWAPVVGASNYKIYNNGSQISTVNETRYMLPAGIFNITVEAGVSSGYSYSYAPTLVSGVMLSSPSYINYADGTFTWESVYGADYYKVVINGEEHTATTNSYVYTGEPQDINISVSACSNVANSYSSAALESVCYYLKPIENVQFTNEGALTWNAVENASSYTLNINGTAVNSEMNEYRDFQYDTPYTVTIKPEKHGYMYYTGAEFAYSFEKLSPVTGISFAEGVITWNVHSRASKYELVINGEVYETTSTTYTLERPNYDITVEVYAIGSGENCRSVTSDKITYNFLQPVSNFRVKDGILVWDATDKATSYDLRFSDGSTQTVSATEFTSVVPGVQYIVKIIPRGENAYYYSYWSGELTFQVLQAPTIKYEQGVLKWNSSSSARGFNIKIEKPDGNTHIFDTTSAVYNYSFSDVGAYKVSVQAVADASLVNTYDSAYSAPLSVKRLATPSGHSILNNSGVNDTVQIAINNVESACGYKVFISDSNETKFESNEFALDLLSLDKDHSEKTYKISVVATGTVTTSEIILDSLNKYEFNLTRLATPTDLEANGTQIKWTNVNHATKYYVAIGGKKIETNTSTYQFTDLQPGKYKVKVQAANPDNANYILSHYSAELEIEKLATPTNVILKTTADGSVFLEWAKVEDATGYTVRFGDRYFNTSYNNYKISDHFNTIEEGSGLQITVCAIGNGKDIIDSEPSATKTVAKLPKPSNITVSGSNITWNSSSVDGIAATDYILYVRTSEGTKEISVTGTSYSCAEFIPGSYNVSVAAVGSIISDGSACTLDSSKSSEILVTKLGKIENLHGVAGTNTITWDPVEGAGSYSIMVDGEKHSTTTTSFDVNFSEAGEHTIVVQAISNNPNTLSGEATTFTQIVKAIKTPVYVKYADDMAELNLGEFTIIQNGANVTIKVAPYTDMPVKYDYIFGASYKTESNTHSIVLENAGIDYYLQIRVLYKGFGSDGVYYVDSNLSQEVALSWFN